MQVEPGSHPEGQLRFLVESLDFRDSADPGKAHREWLPLVHPDLNSETPASVIRLQQLPRQPPTGPHDWKAGDALEVTP